MSIMSTRNSYPLDVVLSPEEIDAIVDAIEWHPGEGSCKRSVNNEANTYKEGTLPHYISPLRNPSKNEILTPSDRLGPFRKH